MSMQRYLGFFGIILTALGLFWLWQELNNPQKMPVRTVQVAATYQQVNQAQLQEIISPFVNMSFFAVNVAALRERLLLVPWIADASIQLTWPDKVKIQIKEQQAKARWGVRAVFNTEGELFTPAQASIPEGLPQLLGPEGFEKKTLQEFDNMSKILKSIDLKIDRLSVNERLSWSLQLNNGITLLLGHEEPLKRLKRFVIIYPQVFSGETNNVKAVQVDMRYPSGMAVQWRPNPSQ